MTKGRIKAKVGNNDNETKDGKGKGVKDNKGGKIREIWI